MMKLFFGVFFIVLLFFSCSNNPSKTTAVAASTTEELEAVTGSDVEAPNTTTTATEEPTPEPELIIEDKARPRAETTPPTPKPAPKPAPITKSVNNKESKTIGTKPNFPGYSHDKLDKLLSKHVSSSGKVSYRTLKKDQAFLEDYINMLELNLPKADWSKNKQMAYWINLYNAFTIYAILEKYPIQSIKDLEGGNIWDYTTITIGGERLTLNDIEKKKLLKQFKDPRIHFAVNCAAASCPPLLNKAWTEDNVQRYLQKQTKAFINNSAQNKLSAKSIQVSQIFNWYADDFGGKGKIISYFQKYADTDIEDNAQVTFQEYDWGLND